MSRHLSPTTFIRYRKCPHQVKLIKVDRLLEEGIDQTLAMAVGNLFDISVKAHINRRVNRDQEMASKVPDENLRRSAMLVVDQIWEVYKDGPFTSLKNEGIGYVGVDQEVILQWKDKESLLYGLPDLTLTDGTVIDWKVNGAFGRGADPTPGYVYLHHRGKKLIGDEDNTPMTKINEEWAIQLYLYSRLLGHKPGAKLRGGIEQIAIKDNDIKCVTYRAPIPEDWQLQIEEEFHLAYDNLFGQGKVPEPHYSNSRCIQYGRVCAVAQHCKAWKRFQEFKND